MISDLDHPVFRRRNHQGHFGFREALCSALVDTAAHWPDLGFGSALQRSLSFSTLAQSDGRLSQAQYACFRGGQYGFAAM